MFFLSQWDVLNQGDSSRDTRFLAVSCTVPACWHPAPLPPLSRNLLLMPRFQHQLKPREAPHGPKALQTLSAARGPCGCQKKSPSRVFSGGLRPPAAESAAPTARWTTRGGRGSPQPRPQLSGLAPPAPHGSRSGHPASAPKRGYAGTAPSKRDSVVSSNVVLAPGFSLLTKALPLNISDGELLIHPALSIAGLSLRFGTAKFDLF